MIHLSGYHLWNGVVELGYTLHMWLCAATWSMLFHSIILLFRSITEVDGVAAA